MTYLVTGVAGFIGYHVAHALLERGARVIGIDNLNDYYSPQLKKARLARLERYGNSLRFVAADIATAEAIPEAVGTETVSTIIHLAAQAGVRYSLENPRAYINANVMGHLNVLEFARHHDAIENVVFASSSSVYGGNEKQPFSEKDRVDTPVSLYAATKRADELISHTYSHLYQIPQTGLRFFTVYGPWGRPDMAYWTFAESIMEGRPLKIFNHGEMLRDFTYIDDIVAGVLAAADRPAVGEVPMKIYNIGNNRPEPLMKFVAVLEDAIGRKAELEMLPMQAGDVPATYADIEAIRADLGFEPTTDLETGIPRFVEWLRRYRSATTTSPQI